MATKTKIEWCDMTINPVVGCSKCSPGCDNCYAEKMAYRLSKNPKTAAKYAGVVDENGWTGKVSNFEMSCFDNLPKRRKHIFVGSMTDIFHENMADDEGLRAMFKAFAEYSQHTFILLTKRHKRLAEAIGWLCDMDGEIADNVWLGVTVCNQPEADEKIPLLLGTSAAVRFVSVEPMLGPVDLSPYIGVFGDNFTDVHYTKYGWKMDEWSGGFIGPGTRGNDHTYNPLPALNWVICGGETGPNARLMHPDWARSLRDQCQGAGVPFFFKGWGEYINLGQTPQKAKGNYADVWNLVCNFRVGKKRAGRLLDGQEWNEFPEVRP